MYILRISVPDKGEYFFAKSNLKNNEGMRLTKHLGDAQTYTSRNSAKCGISGFKSDLDSILFIYGSNSRNKTPHRNELVRHIIKSLEAGVSLAVGIVEAQIVLVDNQEDVESVDLSL